MAEETPPGGEVPLVRHLDDVLAARDALDVLPAEGIDVVLVFRVDRGLPRELPVFPGDRDAVAPFGVLPQVVRDALRLRLELVVRDQIRCVGELRSEERRVGKECRSGWWVWL